MTATTKFKVGDKLFYLPKSSRKAPVTVSKVNDDGVLVMPDFPRGRSRVWFVNNNALDRLGLRGPRSYTLEDHDLQDLS